MVKKRKGIRQQRGVAAISLFCGAGGLDIGAHMAGVKVVSSLDFDLDSIRTIRANEQHHPGTSYHADIVGFETKNFAADLKKARPEGVIVVGGPPCQPFSKNGYWIRNENRLAMLDPRNMIEQYFRVVEELSPDGFLLENVESLLHPTNRAAVEYITDRAKQLDFHYKIYVANAADFGVPQRRKRVFIMGSRRRFGFEGPARTNVVTEGRDMFADLPPHPGVRSFIEKYDHASYFEPQEVAESGTYFNDLTKVPPGKNYLVLTANAGYKNAKFVAGKRFWNFLLKLHPEEPSWTIPAQPGPWVGPFHWKNRRLRVPEIAAIQTFPDEYKFVGNRRSIQKQIGNAVPPLLAKAMVAHLVGNM